MLRLITTDSLKTSPADTMAAWTSPDTVTVSPSPSGAAFMELFGAGVYIVLGHALVAVFHQ
ncbi:MAG: hypothetical protein FJ110_19430 [Deltaproteobacteria bacterium]|nr:hypothetical protein [Deltaproteobacteria bacterium]